MAGHPPRGRPPTVPAARSPHRACKPRGQCWAPTPAHPRSQHVGGGPQQPAQRVDSSGGEKRLTSDAPHNSERHPPRERPSGTSTARNAGPQGRTLWGRCRVPAPTPTAPGTRGSRNPWLPAPEDGRLGEGQRLTPDAPHNGGRPPPPGDGPPPPPRHAAPAGHASQGDSAGPPHLNTRAHSTWVVDPDSPPRGRAARGGGVPDLTRTSQRQKAQPPGTPFCHPRSAQRRPARAHAVGPVLGLHARTNRTRDTPVAEPWLLAPEDRRPAEGRRMTPEAPHNGGRSSPRGRPPTTPAARSPHRACRPRGQCWATKPGHLRPQHMGSGPRQPAQRAGRRGKGSA